MDTPRPTLLIGQQVDTPRPTLLIISLEIVWTGIILLHAHPQVLYCKGEILYQYWFIPKGGTAQEI